MSYLERCVVLGAGGQVGSALVEQLHAQPGGARGALGLDRADADLAHVDSVLAKLATLNPTCVINAAAYTQVDQAERETDLVERVNNLAPRALAAFCRERGLPLLHYSTDYVFSGEGEQPQSEGDTTEPVNAYGRAKLSAERGIAEQGGKFLILRTSWVYSAQGRNFLRSMLQLAKERTVLSVVTDQIGAPTFASHLARTTLEMLERAETMPGFPSGVYHVCNAGFTSWYGFAEAIFERARARGMTLKLQELKAILSRDYPTAAKRPHNSRLSLDKLQRTFGIAMPAWQSALAECMERILP